MLKTLALAAAALLCSATAFADSGIRRVPCGFQQITVTTVQSLTIPSTCTNASLAVVKVETAAVRYRDDGVAPTAAIGMPVTATDAPIYYEGTISALQFVAQSGSGVVDVLLYK